MLKSRSRKALAAALLALSALNLSACSSTSCIRHSDCDPVLVCASGTCVHPEVPDAGPMDGAEMDLLAMDSGSEASTDGAADSDVMSDATRDASTADAAGESDAAGLDAGDGP